MTRSAHSKLSLNTIRSNLEQFDLIEASKVEGFPAAGDAALRTDSRALLEGDVFLAYRGIATDGHSYISDAARKAGLIIFEDGGIEKPPCPWIQVSDARAAWAVLESAYFGHPATKLTMIGVTGTNGKTSTAWYFHQLCRVHGIPCCFIGTLGAWLNDEFQPTTHTTPDPPALYRLLSQAVQKEIPFCVMEVSSHALAMKKLLPIKYSRTVFTSFSRDHLDLHKDMASYRATKMQLFGQQSAEGARAFIARGIEGRDIEGIPNRERYSIEDVDYQTHADQASSSLTIGQHAGKIPLIGRVSLENFLVAVKIFQSLDLDMNPQAWSKVKGVPGRLEIVSKPGQALVVVDYAHTPDALEIALQTLRPITEGSLHVVFGCGGDRDQGKRPLMGAVAGRLADHVWLTSDNPRHEDPDRILSDIEAGIPDQHSVTVLSERRLAIQSAITKAGQSDTVLIAGKGHEDYMLIGDRVLEFDDREVAREALGKE